MINQFQPPFEEYLNLENIQYYLLDKAYLLPDDLHLFGVKFSEYK